MKMHENTSQDMNIHENTSQDMKVHEDVSQYVTKLHEKYVTRHEHA